MFSNVTSSRGMEAIASRLSLVSFKIFAVPVWISSGVKYHTMGGPAIAVAVAVVVAAAFEASARSTSLGAQFPQN